MKKYLLTLALLAATPFAAMADDATQASPMTQDFIKNATIGGKFEVESSQLALQKSQNDQVKQFAQMMITDHTKADHQLKDTVKSANIDTAVIPNALDTKHQAIEDSLQSASGTDFDTQYIKAQTDGHNETIALFKKYAKNGDNAALKTFATQTLPTLKSHRQHLKMIKASS